MTPSATGVPFIAIMTLACVAMIGLGFLSRPSRATAMWSFAFVLGMLASYAMLAAAIVDDEALRALGAGIFLPANGFIWLGLRHASGSGRGGWPWAAGYLVASPVALLATARTDAYSIAFRIDFVVAAVFAVLIIVELVRLFPVFREELLPLGFGAAIFPVFAVYTLLDGVVRALGAPADDDLATVRGVNGVGTGVYVVCALITLLLVARRPRAAVGEGESAAFEAVARGRLARAAAADDAWWSLVDIRLDDPADLRTAFGGTAFERTAERFRADVLAVLPADADIERHDTRLVALVPRSQEAVRRLLVTLLARVSAADHPNGIRVSASIGWAPVAPVGYDLEALRTAAAEAHAMAFEKGGDRWERAVEPCATDAGGR
ncbi:hypothetical protein [Microbacterium gilvum]|uniref:GGDEF domain-containing protein n=1 Tax=Microbacterium gilvum TaxID=1336204 RepID=A0ABP9AB59_9MICO